MWRRINGIFLYHCIGEQHIILSNRVLLRLAKCRIMTTTTMTILQTFNAVLKRSCMWVRFGFHENKIDLSNTKVRFITREHVIYTQSTYTTLLRAQRSYINFWLLYCCCYLIYVYHFFPLYMKFCLCNMKRSVCLFCILWI